jgi:hypothetical protein
VSGGISAVQGSEEDSINDAEGGAVDSDAKRQRECDSDSQQRSLFEQSKPEFKILGQSSHNRLLKEKRSVTVCHFKS